MKMFCKKKNKNKRKCPMEIRTLSNLAHKGLNSELALL